MHDDHEKAQRDLFQITKKNILYLDPQSSTLNPEPKNPYTLERKTYTGDEHASSRHRSPRNARQHRPGSRLSLFSLFPRSLSCVCARSPSFSFLL